MPHEVAERPVAGAAAREASTGAFSGDRAAWARSRRRPARRAARIPVPGRQPRNCPVCERSLVGLPVEGTCPDCRFAYDRHTRSWTGHNALRLGTPIVLTAVGTACLALYWQVAWVFWPLLIALPLYAAWTTWDTLVRMDGRFAAVSPVGVHFRLRRLGVRTIPWERVVSVTASACRKPRLAYLSRHAWLNRLGARQVNLSPAFACMADGCEFAYAVNEGRRRFDARQAAAPAPDAPPNRA